MGLVAEKATSRIGKSKIVLKEMQVTRPSQHLNKPISGVNFINPKRRHLNAKNGV